MKRHDARIKVMQALYQMELSEATVEEAYHNVCEHEEDRFVHQLLFGTVEQLAKIDQLVEQHLSGWNLARLASVDRAILRLAVYELGWMEQIPERVSLNEAIELAKEFGSEESHKFINGVLASVAATFAASSQGE